MEEVVEKIPWKWIIPFTIVANAGLSIVTLFSTTADLCILQFGMTGPSVNPTPWIAMIFAFLLSRVYTKFRLNPKTLVYAYIILLTTSIWTGFFGFSDTHVDLMWARTQNPEIHGKYMPWFWFPSADAIRASFLGGQPIHPEWGVPYLFWIAYSLGWSALMLGTALLLSRQWIEVESIPMPLANAGWQIVTMVSQPKAPEEEKKKRRWVWIFLLIGFLVYLPLLMQAIYPPFPDIYGWYKAPYAIPWAAGSLDFVMLFPALASSIVGLTWLNTNPLMTFLALLMPLDSLFSATVGYLVIWFLIPQILHSMGFYSGILAQDSWTRFQRIYTEEPLKMGAFIDIGMVAGVVVGFLLISYKPILRMSVRALIGGRVEGKDKEEVTFYRIGYLLIVVSLIVVFGLLGASGISAIPILILIWVNWVQSFSMSRCYNYTGFQPWLCQKQAPGWFRPYWGPSIPEGKETGEQLLTLTIANRVNDCVDGTENGYGMAFYTFENFKMGSLAGLRKMNTFKVMLLAMIVGPIVAIPATLWGYYYFGLMKIPMCKEWDHFWTGHGGWYTTWPALEPIWPSATAGFVFTLVLTFLRMRFVRWPLEPLGILVSSSGLAWSNVPLTPFLFAWIIKLIVLRVGGTKLYVDKVVPAAIGFVLGYAFGTLTSTIVLVYRWQFPY